MSIVARFHRAFRQPAPAVMPLEPDPSLVRLRARLIREEFDEVMVELAFLAHPQSPEDVVAAYQRLVKELADLRYVVEGCAVALGLPIEEAFAEVHRSNMSKLGADGQPIFREDGKVLKGPGYTPADMSRIVPNIIEHKEDPAA